VKFERTNVKMDTSILTMIGVVCVVVLALYVWDRRTKQQPIDWMDAAKITIGAGGLAGGVTYAVGGSEGVTNIAESATTMVQEMFVGKPDW
jgi:hypothetical protein